MRGRLRDLAPGGCWHRCAKERGKGRSRSVGTVVVTMDVVWVVRLVACPGLEMKDGGMNDAPGRFGEERGASKRAFSSLAFHLLRTD
jgi:hypothetical protein